MKANANINLGKEADTKNKRKAKLEPHVRQHINGYLKAISRGKSEIYRSFKLNFKAEIKLKTKVEANSRPKVKADKTAISKLKSRKSIKYSGVDDSAGPKYGKLEQAEFEV